MLTRTMPSVMRALGSALDSQTLKSFTQALGNCNQPLEHRGNVEMSPTNYFIRQGEYGGDTYNQGYSSNQYTQYNPTFQNIYAPNFGDFNPIFPPPFFPDPILPPNLDPGDQFIDIGGDINNNINNNLYPSTFFFPTTNNFSYTTNNHIGGNTTIDNSTTENSYITNNNTTNLFVRNINGNPIQGPSGPPGQPGADGRDGRDGAPGAPGALIPVPFPVITPPGVPPYPQPVPRDIQVLVPGGEPFVAVPKYKLVGEPGFDPETCTVTLGNLAIEEDGEAFYNVEGGPEIDTVTVFGPPVA